MHALLALMLLLLIHYLAPSNTALPSSQEEGAKVKSYPTYYRKGKIIS